MEKRTSSLQRRRSILSVLPSSSYIQKSERGRSRNRVVTLDDVNTNKVTANRRNDNSSMDVDLQGNIVSSTQQQLQPSTSRHHLLQADNEDEIERSGNKSSEVDQNLSTAPDDKIMTYFTHIDKDIYQCPLCSN